MDEKNALTLRPWRVGRKLGVTLYAQMGADADNDDILLALFDSVAGAEMARFVADLHNHWLKAHNDA